MSSPQLSGPLGKSEYQQLIWLSDKLQILKEHSNEEEGREIDQYQDIALAAFATAEEAPFWVAFQELERWQKTLEQRRGS